MKTRQGFVSNSSSSSFIVRRQGLRDDIIQTTTIQDLALKEFGFRKTTAHNPHQLPPFHDKEEWKTERKLLRLKVYKKGFNFGYEVICNQNVVITFLVENRISFVAACHYGHESVLYDGKTDTMHVGVNYGSIMETYGVPDVFNDIYLDKRRPVVKMTGKEWLKTNRY
jgi:hypothetical protein